LPRQPLTPVDADLELEGKPGLQPHVHPAKERMDVIVIQMRTLAALAANGQTTVRHFFRVESPTRFHAVQHANQSLADIVSLSNLPGKFLLIGVAGIQVAIALQLFRLGHQGCRHDLLGDLGGIGFELATPDVIDSQQNIHSMGSIEFPQLAFEDHSVKPLQHAGDKNGKLL